MFLKVYQKCVADANTLIKKGEYQSALSTLGSIEKHISDFNTDTDSYYKAKYYAYLGLYDYGRAQECLSYLSDKTVVEENAKETKTHSVQNDLNAEPTDYAVMQLRMSSRDISAGSGWLLRSPFTVGHGNSARCASAYNGMNYNLKSSVLSTLQDYNYSIRPAMWVSISG